MIKNLRIRFVCVVMAIVTVMLCVILGLVIHFTAKSLENQSFGMMQALVPGGPPGREVRPQVRLPYFSVEVNRDGGILSTAGDSQLVAEGELPELLLTVLESDRESGTLRPFDLRFRKNNTPVGIRVIFADISAEKATLEGLVQTCIGIGIAALLVFWFITVQLAKWVVRPVEEAWQQQKQFVADASHELKTPLTVITTNAELLQSQGQPAESILIMTRQMRQLVEGMLELARVDNGSVQTAFQELELDSLVEAVLLPFEPLFFERQLTLESQICGKFRVKGSQEHLKQVLDILLDNAMKYSSPKGTVRLTLTKQGSCALMAVESPGDAISREDLRNIFKRFYRVNKARSRDGSYGLGLSIAQRIVEEHNGNIWAESAGGKNTFFVQLPLL